MTTKPRRCAPANATPFGLAAYIWTRDLGRAFRVAEALDYGIVGVNDGLPVDAARAVRRREGFRESAAKADSRGLDEYLDVKYVSMLLPE